jgi:hypothetical protein
MPHHQSFQHTGGFVPYPPPQYPRSSTTDSDSLDSLSREVGLTTDFAEQSHHGHDNNSNSNNSNTTTTTTTMDEQFFVVGDLDLEQLDPWRRNVPSPMPRITDAITQGVFLFC